MRCQQLVLEYFPKMRDFMLPQTGLLRSMLGPSDLGPGGSSYNEPISHLQHPIYEQFCQTIKWHKCAFGSLPLNASWVKSIMHMLFMPVYLSSVIHTHVEAKFWAE